MLSRGAQYDATFFAALPPSVRESPTSRSPAKRERAVFSEEEALAARGIPARRLNSADGAMASAVVDDLLLAAGRQRGGPAAASTAEPSADSNVKVARS